MVDLIDMPSARQIAFFSLVTMSLAIAFGVRSLLVDEGVEQILDEVETMGSDLPLSETDIHTVSRSGTDLDGKPWKDKVGVHYLFAAPPNPKFVNRRVVESLEALGYSLTEGHCAGDVRFPDESSDEVFPKDFASFERTEPRSLVQFFGPSKIESPESEFLNLQISMWWTFDAEPKPRAGSEIPECFR